MRSVVLIIPGRLDTPTGGYLYNRHMAEGLRQHGWSVEVRELDESFPYPTPAALANAAEVLAGLRDGARLLIDGLALGAMPEVIEREAARLRIAALVHLPLGADVSIEPRYGLPARGGRAPGAGRCVTDHRHGSSHDRHVGSLRHRARQDRRGRAGDDARTACARLWWNTCCSSSQWQR